MKKPIRTRRRPQRPLAVAEQVIVTGGTDTYPAVEYDFVPNR